LICLAFSQSGWAADKAFFTGATSRPPALFSVAQQASKALQSEMAKKGLATAAVKARAIDVGAESKAFGRLLEDAKARYLEGDFDSALAAVEDAEARFMKELAATDDQESWAAYHSLLFIQALALDRKGRSDAARKTLAHLAAIAPGIEPDSSLVPPDMARRFSEVVAGTKKRRAGALSVKSSLPGAEVFVDGRWRGKTPLKINDLLAGRHHVAIHQSGQWTLKRVMLKKATVQIQVDLVDSRTAAGEEVLDQLQQDPEPDALAGLVKNAPSPFVVGLLLPRADRFVLLVGVLSPNGKSTVYGAGLKNDLADLDPAASALAKAVADDAPGAWVHGNDALTPQALRDLFFGVAPSPTTGEDEGSSTALWVGLGVGAGVLVAGGTAAALALLFYDAEGQNQADFVVDASGL
jgi:hypothetical protein